MTTTPLTVLVVGATGSIGRLVVAESVAQNHTTRAMVRDAGKAGGLLPAEAGLVVADVTRPGTLPAAVAGVDAIVLTLGSFGAAPSSPENVDYAGVRNVLTALDAHKPHIVLMTSIGATTRTSSYGHLLEWKRRSERLVRASGLPHPVGGVDQGRRHRQPRLERRPAVRPVRLRGRYPADQARLGDVRRRPADRHPHEDRHRRRHGQGRHTLRHHPRRNQGDADAHLAGRDDGPGGRAHLRRLAARRHGERHHRPYERLLHRQRQRPHIRGQGLLVRLLHRAAGHLDLHRHRHGPSRQPRPGQTGQQQQQPGERQLGQEPPHRRCPGQCDRRQGLHQQRILLRRRQRNPRLGGDRPGRRHRPRRRTPLPPYGHTGGRRRHGGLPGRLHDPDPPGRGRHVHHRPHRHRPGQPRRAGADVRLQDHHRPPRPPAGHQTRQARLRRDHQVPLQLAELTVPTAATTVTANHTLENGDWGKTRLLDGNLTGTAGAKGFTSIDFPAADVSGTPVWIEIDLGADRAIGSVVLHPRTDTGASGGGTAGFPVDFTLQTRTDGGTSYTTARTITGEPNPNGAAQTYALASANGRYLRLKATRLGKPASDESTRYRLQLAEIRVV